MDTPVMLQGGMAPKWDPRSTNSIQRGQNQEEKLSGGWGRAARQPQPALCQLHPSPAPLRGETALGGSWFSLSLCSLHGGREPAGKGTGRRGQRSWIKIILCRNLNEREKRGKRRERSSFCKAAPQTQPQAELGLSAAGSQQCSSAGWFVLI